MSDLLLPDVSVSLTGEDDNAFSIIARVSRAMRKAGYSDMVEEYVTEATAGDYDHLLQTTMRWVDIS